MILKSQVLNYSKESIKIKHSQNLTSFFPSNFLIGNFSFYEGFLKPFRQNELQKSFRIFTSISLIQEISHDSHYQAEHHAKKDVYPGPQSSRVGQEVRSDDLGRRQVALLTVGQPGSGRRGTVKFLGERPETNVILVCFHDSKRDFFCTRFE